MELMIADLTRQPLFLVTSMPKLQNAPGMSVLRDNDGVVIRDSDGNPIITSW